MSEKTQKDLTDTGASDQPRHRAADDEGYRAPSVDETGVAQHSIFDGAGNEIVVVTTGNDEHVVKQGTGASAEEALADAQSTDGSIGEGFNPPPGH